MQHKAIHIFYKKTDGSSREIAVKIADIRLKSILKDMVGQDISGIPYFSVPTIALT